MVLTLKIDTTELYGKDGIDFENLLSDSFKREIIKDCKTGLAAEKFKEFSELVSDTIIADIKLKMENFLSEEITLTEGWGKTTFVGSIEDLIKKRFDDILLRPVDSSGKTLQGCTTSGNSWIEWKIGKDLESTVNVITNKASKEIEKSVSQKITQKIIEIKDGAVRKQVDEAFAGMIAKIS